MNDGQPTHPSRDRLAAFPSGGLGQAEAAVIADHLTGCPTCRALVETLPENSFSTIPPPSQLTPVAGDSPEHFAHYRVIKLLGQGGMGSVYLAHDTRLDRPVALKVPHFRLDDGPQVVERFYREARAAARIEHPNICPVYEVGDNNGTPYLAMRYLEGKPLSEFVKPGQPLPLRTAASLVARLAQALHVAHANGVIHRDLKPSNVMILKSREPVIMDFGLARQVNKGDVRMTCSGAILGTPAYMSPEQAAGDVDAVGPASDLYSLGVVLYELLTSRVPFEGPIAVVLGQIHAVEPPPPSAYRPDLDPQLEAICRKAMAKKAGDRYASMGDLAAALSAYLRTTHSQSGPRASLTSTAERQAPLANTDSFHPKAGPSQKPQGEPGRRRLSPRAWLGVGGGVILLLGVALVFLLGRAKTAPEDRSAGPQLSLTPRQVEPVPSSVPAPLPGPPGATGRGFPLPAAPAGPTAPDLDAATREAMLEANRRRLEGFSAAPDLEAARKPFEAHRRLGLGAGGEDPKLPLNATETGCLTGHTGGVLAVAFSPDGKLLATGSDDNSARLWDVAKASPLATFKGHNNPVRCVAFSLDGKRMASGSSGGYDGGVKLWDLTSGKEAAPPLKWSEKISPSSVGSLAFSPDGHLLAVGGSGPVRLWDLQEGRQKSAFDWQQSFPSHVHCLVFSPDGKTVAAGCYEMRETVRLWNAVTGAEGDVLVGNKNPFGLSHDSYRGAVVYSSNGKLLARATSNGGNSQAGSLLLWDVVPESGQPTLRSSHELPEGGVYAVAILADGNILVAAADGSPQLMGFRKASSDVHVWDLAGGQTRTLATGHAGRVVSLAFSPDGTLLATGSDDNRVKLWKVNLSDKSPKPAK